MIDLDYPKLLDLFREHLIPKKRTESASFLIWYLKNYYRLDDGEAVDSVCDQRGDKGVDGVFVNDGNKTITVFQAKINQKSNSTIGDASLREFAGTLTQFKDAQTLSLVQKSAKNVKLGELIQRLDLVSKIDSYELKAEFISNVDIDQNGKDFIEATSPHVSFVGKKKLTKTYISDKRESVIHKAVKFDVSGFTVTEYTVDAATKATIAPVKATELVKMEGIEDQSLFEYNVRGPLGKTLVNKDIAASINDAGLHKLFPLFHNGITIICESLKTAPETLTASGYFVVNGCQSLTALFNNSRKLTEDLRILTKFIQMDPASENAAMVTRFSNNQNGVSDRDFMANNAIQIRLQNEFKATYNNQYGLEIKRGEVAPRGIVISNEDAGLFLMAFDLKEPWATHRKYQVFESKYAEIFGRPEVTADRIVMCQVIKEAIDAVEPKIENALLARYRLTRYLLLYIIREILESSETGKQALDDPKVFVRSSVDRKHFKACIEAILKDIIIDLNQEVKEFGDDFDYRGRLRDAEWVRKMAKTLVTDHLKQVSRKRVPSFKQEWEDRPVRKGGKN
ncbi:MAG TPA: AIPR family protein [Bryobacteraceae bacterium]|nr:AIPR family protein [Bryobacteraceae bacterium]